jgi:hypothetical protein
MSRIVIAILIYHRHKPVDSIVDHSPAFSAGIKESGAILTLLTTLS